MSQNKKNELYVSLIPFLEQSGLYYKLQKIIKENKFLMKNTTPFQLAIYLIGKELGAGNYVAKFTDFEKKND